jgi:hypothetical protein
VALLFMVVSMIWLSVAVSRLVLRRFGSRETMPELQCDVLIHRAGVRLFLMHTQNRQHVEYDARFDFKLPRQLVDPDFLHRRNC